MAVNAIRYFIKAAFLGAFFLVSLAQASERNIESTIIFPGTSIALEDGDVILNDGLSFTSGMSIMFAYPAGLYSHAAVVVKFPNLGERIVSYSNDGIEIHKPKEFISGNFRVALLRPISKPQAGTLAKALQALSKRQLEFDYQMAWPGIDSNSTYCVGFISQLFLVAEPEMVHLFPVPSERPRDFWSDWVKQKLNTDLSRIASPNIFLSNQNFKLLAEYQSDAEALLVQYWIRKSFFEKVEAFIRNDRLDITPLKLGSRLAFLAARAGVLDGVTLADLPSGIQEKFIIIYEFMTLVEERAKRTMRLNDDQVWNEKSVKSLAAEVADSFRDDFFVFPPRQ